jgi:hypothetical protein
MNVDNMENVRCEASRTFGTNNKEYLKDKINELETNSLDKHTRDLYRGTYVKKGYQPGSNLVICLQFPQYAE